MDCIYGEHKAFEGRAIKHGTSGSRGVVIECLACRRPITLCLIKRNGKTATA